ncbi:hypothetical protein OsJ_01038 [Oryza sativa Japonica Group]|uniref:NmrA-like domain-containing protein n=1 Tax=Oryza sativa subsp. japonica TaxID=39947 RepID=A2ZR42_ORYSJ|nr:hypothetical protein OsJ_01038 [Oryza sativa Japonica Group]
MTKTKKSNNDSTILVIGGTGIIGRHIVAASLDAGHPTLVLVRPTAASAAVDVDSDKAKLLASLVASGATIVYGDMNDRESLVAAIRQADVVISAVGHRGTVELDGQLKVVEAIKEAGNVKRFVPSEYGCDVEQAEEGTLEPARSIIAAKDMSAVAIKAMEDERAANKILYVRPPANKLSLGQLVRLWEKKSGNTLQKRYVSDLQLANQVQEAPFPVNFQLAMVHSTLVAGVCEQTINPDVGAEATELYPEMDFLTVDSYLDALLLHA